jgi:hypothetical protein
MKVLQLLLACALMLSLSSCSTLGSVLATPFRWLGGLAKAATRTVTQNEMPAGGVNEDPVVSRGVEIAAKGSFGNAGASPPESAPSTVARR